MKMISRRKNDLAAHALIRWPRSGRRSERSSGGNELLRGIRRLMWYDKLMKDVSLKKAQNAQKEQSKLLPLFVANTLS